MTPVWDELVGELGDPLDPFPWHLSEACWEFAKLLTWNPTALWHQPPQAYRRADAELMRARRRSDAALMALLRDEGLQVTVRSYL